MIKVLEVIDDRYTGIKLGKEECRSESTVADDQVRAEVALGFAGIVNCVCVPDGVFESARAEMGGLARAAFETISDLFDRARRAVRGLGAGGDEGALPGHFRRQVMGDVAELAGVVGVDEEDVHGAGV